MATIGKTLFAHFRQVLHASAQYDQAITVFHWLKKRLEVSNLCSQSWDQTVTFSDLAHGLVWASPAPRREAPRGRTTPRLPVNDWGKVLLACTCVTSHATYKKKAGRDWILTRSVSLIFAILTRSLKRPGSIWAAGRLISQSAFVIP